MNTYRYECHTRPVKYPKLLYCVGGWLGIVKLLASVVGWCQSLSVTLTRTYPWSAATQIWKIQDLSSKIRQIRKETPVELQKVKFIIRHCKYFAVSWLSVDIRIVSFHDQELWVFECLLTISRESFIDVHWSVDLHIPSIPDQCIKYDWSSTVQ